MGRKVGRSESRSVINAVGRLRDVNTPLVGDMQDMPHLVRATVEDLRKECGPEWEALNVQGFDDKDVRSAVSKSLARLYRSMLLEEALGVGP